MKYTSLAPALAILGLSLSLTVGCSSSGGSPGTGGTTGAGGTAATGGTTGTGGVKGTGGASGTGGTGGVKGTGGAAGSAGTGGAAGSAGTGGVKGTGGAAGSGATDAGAADGPVMYTLMISNYLAWCNVTENGVGYAATMSFPAGTVVNLNAVPGSFFVWGYWTGTDGDTTASHDTDMTTTVTMTSNKSVLACCPDPPPASQTCP